MRLDTYQNHRTVLGLDPRTTGRACRAENGPRIKSEGGTVGFDGGVQDTYIHRVTPARAGTPVFLSAIANGGSRFRGNDAAGGGNGRSIQ